MGWVIMSERELNRVELLAQVDDGRLTVDNAANLLDLTRRQVFRLLKRYRMDGAAAIRRKARGKPPNNQIHKAKRDYAEALIRESYADFGPTLAAEPNPIIVNSPIPRLQHELSKFVMLRCGKKTSHSYMVQQFCAGKFT